MKLGRANYRPCLCLVRLPIPPSPPNTRLLALSQGWVERGNAALYNPWRIFCPWGKGSRGGKGRAGEFDLSVPGGCGSAASPRRGSPAAGARSSPRVPGGCQPQHPRTREPGEPPFGGCRRLGFGDPRVHPPAAPRAQTPGSGHPRPPPASSAAAGSQQPGTLSPQPSGREGRQPRGRLQGSSHGAAASGLERRSHRNPTQRYVPRFPVGLIPEPPSPSGLFLGLKGKIEPSAKRHVKTNTCHHQSLTK